MNKGVIARQLQIIGHQCAMEFGGMAKPSRPILYEVIREHHLLLWAMAYHLDPHGGRIREDGICGEGAEVAHAMECLACPLGRHFEFIRCSTASELQANVQNRVSDCDCRIECIGKIQPGPVCREPTLSKDRQPREDETQCHLDADVTRYEATSHATNQDVSFYSRDTRGFAPSLSGSHRCRAHDRPTGTWSAFD